MQDIPRQDHDQREPEENARVTAAPDPVEAAMLAEAATTSASIVALLVAAMVAPPSAVTVDPLTRPDSIELPMVLNASAPVPCPPVLLAPPVPTSSEPPASAPLADPPEASVTSHPSDCPPQPTTVPSETTTPLQIRMKLLDAIVSPRQANRSRQA